MFSLFYYSHIFPSWIDIAELHLVPLFIVLFSYFFDLMKHLTLILTANSHCQFIVL